MTTLEANLYTAFVLGLLGSAHCMGMCGGIGLSLGLQNKRSKALTPLIYNLGRIISYACIGGLLGWFTTTLQAHLSVLTLLFRTIAGLLLIAMGLYISGWWLGLTRLEHLGQKLWQPISTVILPTTQKHSTSSALLLGLCWGFLPCGLIYSTLAWASATAINPAESALLMLTFGLGTLPALLLAGYFAQQLRTFFKRRAIRSLLGLMIIGMGLWTIAIPVYHQLGHHHEMPTEQSNSHHHHH